MQSQRAWAVPFWLLLAIYSIIPLACFLIIADRAFFQGRLQALLPQHPGQWPLFNLFFVWPHIFASQLTLLDHEYLGEYRRKLLVGLPLLAVAGVVAGSLSHSYGRLAFDLLTIYHVIFQQTGVAKLMREKVDRSFRAWEWLFFTSFAAAHVGLSRLNTLFLGALIGLGLAGSSFFALRAMRGSKNRVGTLYLAANQGMLLLVVGWYLAGYPVFSFLVPRAVHDLTAFTFYAVHDHNRNQTEAHNLLCRLLRPIRIPAACAGMLAGTALNVLTRSWSGLSTMPQLYFFIAFLHYYTEGFVWKRHAIHRQSIFFQP